MRLSDVCQAFLLPTLNSNEYYFIIPPAGFELLCAERGIPFKKGQVLQLLAAVYGLKNASNYWNTELTAWLTGPAGLTQCVNDPCLFIRTQPFLAVGIHTDDCLTVGSEADLDKFEEQFARKYPIKRLGFPSKFCGLQVERVAHDQSIRVSMKTFTEKLLEKFWIGKINHCYSPASMDKLEDEDPPDTEHYPVRQACGNLIWLIINVRFDIAAAFNIIARKQAKPTAKMVRFIKRVFRYLAATTDFSLVFKRVPPQHFSLQCSSDSGFDVLTLGGYVWFLGSSLISWRVLTAKSAVTSTFEAELFFLCLATKTGVWLVNYAKEVCPQILDNDVVIFNDNRAAIEVVHTGKFSQRTRHMATKCEYIHQQVKNGIFKVEWKATEELRADLLTKNFHPEIFRKKLQLFEGAISLRLLSKRG
jgi:hypothetical protein